MNAIMNANRTHLPNGYAVRTHSLTRAPLLAATNADYLAMSITLRAAEGSYCDEPSAHHNRTLSPFRRLQDTSRSC